MCNKKYKEEYHGGYTINIGAFDIAGALGKPRIMKDGNVSLQTMGLNKNFQDDDVYTSIEVKKGKPSTTDGTEVSTFTTETFPLSDEKRLGILSKIRTLSLRNY